MSVVVFREPLGGMASAPDLEAVVSSPGTPVGVAGAGGHARQAASPAQADAPGSQGLAAEASHAVAEQFNEMKARTMYQMVEDLTVIGKPYQLLFLTNKQAALLENIEDSVPRILDAFEVARDRGKLGEVFKEER